MKNLSVVVRNRRAFKVAPFVLGATIAACVAGCSAGAVDDPQEVEEQSATTSQELRKEEFDYEYYSDATHSKVVGFWVADCYGNSQRWGKITKFAIGSRTSCTSHIHVGCYQYLNGIQDYCPTATC